MPEKKTFRFNNHILYKWEIGSDFITVYDDVKYKHENRFGLLDFLCSKKKLIIYDHGWYYHYQTNRYHQRVRVPLALNMHCDYLENIQIVNSHEKTLCHYHSMRSYGFFNPPKPHCHIKFNQAITLNEINLVIEWMAEYLNKEVTSLKRELSPLVNYFSAKEETLIELQELHSSPNQSVDASPTLQRGCPP